MKADLMSCPTLPELVAAGGQLAHDVGQALVVGVAASLGMQTGNYVAGDWVAVGGKNSTVAGSKNVKSAVLAGSSGLSKRGA